VILNKVTVVPSADGSGIGAAIISAVNFGEN
jgi:hexokinase